MADYKVGVSIVLQNGVSGVLAVISRDLLGLRLPIKQIEDGFKAWKPAILAAAGVLAAGELVKGLSQKLVVRSITNSK